MRSNEVNEKLNKLKIETAGELGLTGNISENKKQYQGNVPSKDNGAKGGPIGGRMVKKMIEAEEQKIANRKDN